MKKQKYKNLPTEEKLLIQLEKYNSWKRRFTLAIFTGFAGAIGATIIAAIVFYYLGKALEAGTEYQWINDLVETLRIKEIFEETCKP